jgi:hypothetical protein
MRLIVLIVWLRWVRLIRWLRLMRWEFFTIRHHFKGDLNGNYLEMEDIFGGRCVGAALDPSRFFLQFIATGKGFKL